MFFQHKEMLNFTLYKRNQSRNCDTNFALQVSKEKKKKFSDTLYGCEEAATLIHWWREWY